MLGKAAKVLRALLEQEKIEYELMFVDDGSKDKTWDCIIQASEEDPGACGRMSGAPEKRWRSAP